jgi:hypothetical protein
MRRTSFDPSYGGALEILRLLSRGCDARQFGRMQRTAVAIAAAGGPGSHGAPHASWIAVALAMTFGLFKNFEVPVSHVKFSTTVLCCFSLPFGCKLRTNLSGVFSVAGWPRKGGKRAPVGALRRVLRLKSRAKLPFEAVKKTLHNLRHALGGLSDCNALRRPIGRQSHGNQMNLSPFFWLRPFPASYQYS